MEKTLFGFIWKHSRRQQVLLFGFTLITFPFLYASLELPKRIINDAIGATTAQINLWGVSLDQVEYLLLLCFAFLATVTIGGLMKMRLNTMKGVLAERMLRRLRYQLISRMLRFPAPYFRTTSQGELVSMITSEAEPMGGLMGDAVAQPAFQFGQMFTILIFLFMQSVWFGLASVALIPLQAWLIPMLQRQINLLNKDRIQEIRHLSSEIGESAAGISDLRANGGWRYRQAQITDRLGRLFAIRFRIYQKKFFMKFLNNMIGHLTPFFFYSVGGYLAIQGQITVGALVAGLAAYKDLSSPWRELLTFYNQVQDMSLRWQVVMERFAPRDMVDETLFEGEPGTIPHLDGAIEFHNVTLHDGDGHAVLEDINLTIPPGARVAIKSAKPSERAAFAQLLTREAVATHGRVIVSGQNIESLHQAVIAARVGHAHSRPYLFDGSLGENLLMPLRLRPLDGTADPRSAAEAERSGNSADPLTAKWVDPALAGLMDTDDIRNWWFQLVEAMGIDEQMFRRTLRSRFDPALHPNLAEKIISLRPQIHDALSRRGVLEQVHRFDPDIFNPTVPLGSNLLYASPARAISQTSLAGDQRFMKMLHDQGLAEEALTIAQGVVETLQQTFGRQDTDHPLFRRLGMDEEIYHRLADIAARRAASGNAQPLSPEDCALMLTVPFLLTAEQIGPAFPDQYKEQIVALRKTKAEQMRKLAGDMFVPVTPGAWMPRLTVLENAIYGRVSSMAGSRAEMIEDTVAEILSREGLREATASIIYDLPTGLGGVNLPTIIQERAAFCRAAIKRPDILVIDHALASHDAPSRLRTRQRLRDLLPKTTMIFMEDRFDHPGDYDIYIEIHDGRIDGLDRAAPEPLSQEGVADLRKKLAVLADTPLFAQLDRRNQRLLAFSAQWFDAAPGQVIFGHDDRADAVYLCLEGEAELLWPDDAQDLPPVTTIRPGRLIGDLSIITRQPRSMDLVATTACRFLRIGADEFRDVIESDLGVALQLLQVMGDNLTGAGRTLHQIRSAQAIDPKAQHTPDSIGVQQDA